MRGCVIKPKKQKNHGRGCAPVGMPKRHHSHRSPAMMIVRAARAVAPLLRH